MGVDDTTRSAGRHAAIYFDKSRIRHARKIAFVPFLLCLVVLESTHCGVISLLLLLIILGLTIPAISAISALNSTTPAIATIAITHASKASFAACLAAPATPGCLRACLAPGGFGMPAARSLRAGAAKASLR